MTPALDKERQDRINAEVNSLSDPRLGWTSASYAERDSLCPGAHLASRGLPDSKSEVAQKGSDIHAWLHWKRTFHEPKQGEEYTVRIEKVDPLELKYASEPVCDYELAGRCWDLECKAVRQWLRSSNNYPDSGAPSTYSERRFWLEFGSLKHSGQADCVVVCGNRAFIWDAKSGFLEVPPPNTNEQLRDLAVLVRNEFRDLEEVTVQIGQPFGKAQPPCVYDEGSLIEAYTRLVNRVIASNDPKSPRVPGEVQCRYCLAKGTSRCPETQLAVTQLSATAQELIANPTAELVAAAKLAQSVAKQILDNARTLLKANPDAIPGCGLKENPPNRPVTDPQTLWARCSAQGLTLEQFLGCISVTKGQLEEALKEVIRAKTGQKRVSGWSDTWSKLLDGVTTEEKKEPSVIVKG